MQKMNEIVSKIYMQKFRAFCILVCKQKMVANSRTDEFIF